MNSIRRKSHGFLYILIVDYQGVTKPHCVKSLRKDRAEIWDSGQSAFRRTSITTLSAHGAHHLSFCTNWPIRVRQRLLPLMGPWIKTQHLHALSRTNTCSCTFAQAFIYIFLTFYILPHWDNSKKNPANMVHTQFFIALKWTMLSVFLTGEQNQIGKLLFKFLNTMKMTDFWAAQMLGMSSVFRMISHM